MVASLPLSQPPPGTVRRLTAAGAGKTSPAIIGAAGTFTSAHEAFWPAARTALGDGGGTRALVEVLLLHRHHTRADVVALQSCKHAQQQATAAATDPVVVSLEAAAWLT